MMRINVHAGHNFHVPGAGGCFSETAEDRKVKNEVIRQLREAGHTVYDCTDEVATNKNQNLANIVAKCNAHKVDLDVSIHFNAFNGGAHGTEVWVHSGSTIRPTAQRIVNNIAALGFTNRGVKDTTSLYVIRKTVAPAMLIECCFCDSAVDAKRYDCKAMATAIAKGIMGNAATKPAPKPKAEKFTVRITSEQTHLRAKASKDSADVGTVQKGDTFVVDDQTENWYKLDCGGWIAKKQCEKV